MSELQQTSSKPTLKEALKFWVKLGFISFGGPAGQIAIMHEYLVDKKKWISDSKFLHALNYCMVLPGPEAQQLATYIGWMLHGTLGGLLAGTLFVLPSMFILLGLSITYVSFGTVPWIYAIFAGLKPAVIAIVIVALLKIGKKSLISPFHYLVAAGAFTAIFFFNVSFPLIILVVIILAAALRKLFPTLISSRVENMSHQEDNEGKYHINKNTQLQNIGFSPLRFWKQILVGLILWTIPFVVLLGWSDDFGFWKTLSLFFSQAALVTFGGAYSVLPYVAQMSVENFHWLTELQMIDGLALGETTPGPLIMVLIFVGFMAGYNHFGNSLAMGSIALGLTTFYTFLPSFLFIFIGAPIIERTQENRRLKEILGLVTAAVVGVILNLTIYLGKAVMFTRSVSVTDFNFIPFFWTVISLIALYQFKVNMIVWIAVSAVFGLGLHFLW